MEENILKEENNKLTEALNQTQKELDKTKIKLRMALELVKGISYLIPNAVLQFNNELERLDGEDKQSGPDTPQEGTREEETEG